MPPIVSDCIMSRFAALPRAELDVIASELRRQDSESSSSAHTPAEYEDAAQRALPAWLLDRCGLRVVPTAATHRLEGEISGGVPDRPATFSFEWDFRAPVTVFGGPPVFSGATTDFFYLSQA